MTASTAPIHFPDHERQLRKLCELAQDNQLAVQDAIACLSAEREAMSKERLALARAWVHSAELTLRRANAESISAMAAATDKSIRASMEQGLASMAQAQDRLQRGATDAIENLRHTSMQALAVIQHAVDRIVKDAMERELGLTHDAATRIWTGAAAPGLERLSAATHLAHEAEARISRMDFRQAWQWAALTALGVVVTIVVAVVSVQQIQTQQANLEKQQSELDVQKQAFAEEMARMQASVTFLEKKGGRMHVDKCGPEQRLCIEVSPDQGTGRGNFRGLWSDPKSERTFVIPKGY